MYQCIKVRVPHKLSNNKWERMNHFDRNNLKKEFYDEVTVAVKQQKIKPVTEYPIPVMYTYYVTGRKLDWTNYGSITKVIEDGLVRMGILKDDSNKHIIHGTIGSATSNTGYNYCMIELN